MQAQDADTQTDGQRGRRTHTDRHTDGRDKIDTNTEAVFVNIGAQGLHALFRDCLFRAAACCDPRAELS